MTTTAIAKDSTDGPVAAKLELGTTPAAVRRLASELRVKKFLTLICHVAESLMSRVVVLQNLSVPSSPTKRATYYCARTTPVTGNMCRTHGMHSAGIPFHAAISPTLFFSIDRDLLDIIILLDQVRHGCFQKFYLAASCNLVKDTEFARPGVRYHYDLASSHWE